jgi:hypothetical protein
MYQCFVRRGVPGTDCTTDKFENISESYALFNEHKIPGGLKVCLATEFGRSLNQSAQTL